jgi:hypothetical protein
MIQAEKRRARMAYKRRSLGRMDDPKDLFKPRRGSPVAKYRIS